MKQTAVEWLETILEGQKDKPFDFEEWSIAFEHAKQLEKEQIVDAFSEGTKMIDVNDEISAMLNGFIYYGETYENRMDL